MIPMSRGADSAKTVIRISPLAHFASAFLSMALLTVGPAFGKAGLVLLAIPVLVSVVIERLRTVADEETVTARYLFTSRTVRWPQIEGLKFTRGRWARRPFIGSFIALLVGVAGPSRARRRGRSGRGRPG